MVLKFMQSPDSTARPDERGRVTLGPSLTKGVSRYDIYVNVETGEVLLRPFREIPANEAWLYENKVAKELIFKGINAAKKKKFSAAKFKAESWINEVEDDK